jgi:methylglyoxal synthase
MPKQPTKPKPKGKTLIGVIASRDDRKINMALVSLFGELHRLDLAGGALRNFHFIFTGGTYDRLFFGVSEPKQELAALEDDVAAWLRDDCGVTRLHPAAEGGVTVLSYLVTQRQCSIVWPFFAPVEHHWLRPENLAFMRLCDQWHVKRLMNRGSVMAWFQHEVQHDTERNRQPCPPQLVLRADTKHPRSFALEVPVGPRPRHLAAQDRLPPGKPVRRRFKDMTIALIAHDEMKNRMIDFAIDHETELMKFGSILSTATTGREVSAATTEEMYRKMHRYHSGPKGGDIELATEILFGQCHVVIFFVDPLRPHPHIEDIRVVFEACMIKDQVVMITNEMHAREFMSRVVRGNEEMVLYQ